MIRNAIESMIEDWIEELINFVITFLEGFLFNYDGLAGYAQDAYNVMVILGGVLMVVLALGKVITQLMTEADGSQQANIWFTIVQSFKSSAMVFLMPLIIAFSMNQIVLPVGNHMINRLGDLGDEFVEQALDVLGFEIAFIPMLVVGILMIIIVGFFIVKVTLAQANLILSEILSPVIAVSMMNETNNMVEQWWKDIIMHCVTIITLTICMVLFTESLVEGRPMMLIGFGALVITGPTIVKSVWYKSGAGRAGSGLAMKMLLLKR